MLTSSAEGSMFTTPAVCEDEFEPQPDISMATAEIVAQSLRKVLKTLVMALSPFHKSWG